MLKVTSRTVMVASGVTALALLLVLLQLSREFGDGGTAPKLSPAPVSQATSHVGQSFTQVAAVVDDDKAVWDQRIEEAVVETFREQIAMAMQIKDIQLRKETISKLIDKWLKDDPADFTKYMASLQVKGDAQSLALVAAALQDSLQMLDVERAASDEILVAVQRLIAYLAETDPEKALAWARQWLLEDAREEALLQVSRSFALTDVDRALGVIGEIQSPLRRSQALATVGGIWARQDAPAALKWAVGIDNKADRALSLNSVLAVIAVNDPATAAENLRDQAIRINEEYRRNRAEELVLLGVSEASLSNDPEGYADMVNSGAIPAPSSPDVELLGDAGRVIGSKLVATGEGDAAQWAESLDSEFLKLKSLGGVLEGWALTNPSAALDHLTTNYPQNTDLLTALYTSWAAADPLAAANGTAWIQDSQKRALALDSVVRMWSARGNPSDVDVYLSGLPAAEQSDGVRLTLANAMSQANPARAWEIASGIGNEATRFKALKIAFSSLVIANPDAAGVLIASSTLTNDTAERLKDILEAVTVK